MNVIITSNIKRVQLRKMYQASKVYVVRKDGKLKAHKDLYRPVKRAAITAIELLREIADDELLYESCV